MEIEGFATFKACPLAMVRRCLRLIRECKMTLSTQTQLPAHMSAGEFAWCYVCVHQDKRSKANSLSLKKRKGKKKVVQKRKGKAKLAKPTTSKLKSKPSSSSSSPK